MVPLSFTLIQFSHHYSQVSKFNELSTTRQKPPLEAAHSSHMTHHLDLIIQFMFDFQRRRTLSMREEFCYFGEVFGDETW